MAGDAKKSDEAKQDDAELTDEKSDEAQKDVEPEAEKDAETPVEPDAEKDAEAEKDAPAETAAGSDAPAGDVFAQKRGIPTLGWVALVVVALAVGLLVGRFLPGDAGAIALSGKTELAASELDSAIAAYTYKGETVKVTAREVIDEMGGTEDTANDDGTYTVPAASDVVTYAQNQIILADAEDRGLTATDEETDELAEQTFGTADYDSISSTYGYDRDYIATMATITKLRDAVVDVTLPEQPTAPDSPEDGQEDVATAEYASYVIDLLGDEWDAEAGTWARTDGEYYATLSSYEFTADAATYDVAQAAYQVAYGAYSDAYTELSNEWVAYTRSLLSNATIQLGSLVAS
ncbi:hypothetical protein B5F79_02705 [Olsenella sp. An285]|uniref:hypothetical protein n=1 Tax=Olsenella sp. An285 TaxID=1965621 RepID=UPI000B37912D|nr:hypothetical protein [Olsenella sp. An285]OUO47744.1 hypothetical protein B5F79_02705 [Olsenella sp. An285]